LRSGYALPHPNCRHEFIPWFEEIESPEDVKKAISDSKIKYDNKGNLLDVRYQRDIEGYAEWQAGNRQLNRELLEYNRMQAHYGENAPYKTLAGFRRASRAQSEEFKKYKAVWSRKIDEEKDLTIVTENSIINLNEEVAIEIDIATPCLVVKKTGEIVKTETENVSHSVATQLDKTGEYEFSWQKIVRDHPNCTLTVLRVKGKPTIEGAIAFEEVKSDNAFVVHNIEKPMHNRGENGKYAGVAKHLFAYVSKIALEQGHDCIEFVSKYSLIEYYKKTLNAQIARGQTMFFLKEEMKKLVDIYYPQGDNDEKK
jgi:hypothetical protein